MTALTRYEPAPTEMDTMQLGKVLAQSGYFQDAREAAQAVVKVLAGKEMGIGPIAAMTGIYIVKGRVTLSANLMAAQIKRSGKYDYVIAQMTNDVCEVVFYELQNGHRSEIGRSSFTKDDAQQAGLWNSSDPWKKTPRNMLFARCMSNGAKWYTPDVFSGPVYTPDELSGSQPTLDAEPPTTAYTPAPVNTETGEMPDDSHQAQIAIIRDLWRQLADAGRPVPAKHLTLDLDALDRAQLTKLEDQAHGWLAKLDAQADLADATSAA